MDELEETIRGYYRIKRKNRTVESEERDKIGEMFRQFREKHELSQADVAEKIDCSPAAVSRTENNRRGGNVALILKFLKEFSE